MLALPLVLAGAGLGEAVASTAAFLIVRIFGVPPARSWQTIGIVAVFGFALAWLRFRLYREMRTDATDRSA